MSANLELAVKAMLWRFGHQESDDSDLKKPKYVKSHQAPRGGRRVSVGEEFLLCTAKKLWGSDSQYDFRQRYRPVGLKVGYTADVVGCVFF